MTSRDSIDAGDSISPADRQKPQQHNSATTRHSLLDSRASRLNEQDASENLIASRSLQKPGENHGITESMLDRR
jgi:hypothetical protein